MSRSVHETIKQYCHESRYVYLDKGAKEKNLARILNSLGKKIRSKKNERVKRQVQKQQQDNFGN